MPTSYLSHPFSLLVQPTSCLPWPQQFRRVFQLCLNFVSGDLSSFYLDTAKDRLYIQAADSSSRRACQTVQAAVLQGLLSAIAPLVPHMAEDAWLNLSSSSSNGAAAGSSSSSSSSSPLSDSVFMAGWATPDPQWSSMSQVGGGGGGGGGVDLVTGRGREVLCTQLSARARASAYLATSCEYMMYRDLCSDSSCACVRRYTHQD